MRELILSDDERSEDFERKKTRPRKRSRTQEKNEPQKKRRIEKPKKRPRKRKRPNSETAPRKRSKQGEKTEELEENSSLNSESIIEHDIRNHWKITMDNFEKAWEETVKAYENQVAMYDFPRAWLGLYRELLATKLANIDKKIEEKEKQNGT